MSPSKAKFDHAQILPLAGIRPAPENESLYRPVDPDDPDIQALADSIRQHGVQEPIVVSADGYILSGHRRHVAAGLAGLVEVPCRVHPLRREDDPDRFVELLREFNRQRIKSFDEVVREEIISADPEEAYEALLEHRSQQSRPVAAAIAIGAGKSRAKISRAKIPMLRAIEQVLRDREVFLPLSVREIHYCLLNDPPLVHASKPGSTYANTDKSYRALSDLLTRARLAGLIPFEHIHDPTRPVTQWNVHGHVGAFVREQMGAFLKKYWRDLQKSQPAHIEIAVEKNTASTAIERVAARYTIPVTSGRGFCSIPPRRGIAERFEKSGKDRLIVLIASDLDPDGEAIAQSLAESMQRDFGITKLDAIRVAVTAEQVKRFNLRPGGKAKKTSANYKKFHATHGDDVYELEALSPGDLQQVVEQAIEGVIDRDALNAEIEAEKKDAAELSILRERAMRIIAGMMGDENA